MELGLQVFLRLTFNLFEVHSGRWRHGSEI